MSSGGTVLHRSMEATRHLDRNWLAFLRSLVSHTMLRHLPPIPTIVIFCSVSLLIPESYPGIISRTESSGICDFSLLDTSFPTVRRLNPTRHLAGLILDVGGATHGVRRNCMQFQNAPD
jgi:hypothetical protein